MGKTKGHGIRKLLAGGQTMMPFLCLVIPLLIVGVKVHFLLSEIIASLPQSTCFLAETGIFFRVFYWGRFDGIL